MSNIITWGLLSYTFNSVELAGIFLTIEFHRESYPPKHQIRVDHSNFSSFAYWVLTRTHPFFYPLLLTFGCAEPRSCDICLVARRPRVSGPISVAGVQWGAVSVVEVGYGGQWPEHWVRPQFSAPAIIPFARIESLAGGMRGILQGWTVCPPGLLPLRGFTDKLSTVLFCFPKLIQKELADN